MGVACLRPQVPGSMPVSIAWQTQIIASISREARINHCPAGSRVAGSSNLHGSVCLR